MKDKFFRDFQVEILNGDGVSIGAMGVPGMYKDSSFVDIVEAAYYGSNTYAPKPKRVAEEEDMTVIVYKIDTAGRKREVNSMDVTIAGDSDFEEVLELCYHGCSDCD